MRAITPDHLVLGHLMFGKGVVPSGTQTQTQAENFAVYSYQVACKFEGLSMPDERTTRLIFALTGPDATHSA